MAEELRRQFEVTEIEEALKTEVINLLRKLSVAKESTQTKDLSCSRLFINLNILRNSYGDMNRLKTFLQKIVFEELSRTRKYMKESEIKGLADKKVEEILDLLPKD